MIDQADEYYWHVAAEALFGMVDSLRSQLDAERAENRQIRELMNTYNLGGWTDSERLIKERDAERAAQEKLRELVGEIMPYLSWEYMQKAKRLLADPDLRSTEEPKR